MRERPAPRRGGCHGVVGRVRSKRYLQIYAVHPSTALINILSWCVTIWRWNRVILEEEDARLSGARALRVPATRQYIFHFQYKYAAGFCLYQIIKAGIHASSSSSSSSTKTLWDLITLNSSFFSFWILKLCAVFVECVWKS